MSLKDTDTSELKDRYNYLIDKYVDLASDLAKKIDKFGKYRRELQLITSEFVERGVDVEGTDSLVEGIAKEIEERDDRP